MCVLEVRSFDKGAQAVAERFKCRQPVILNLQRTNDDLIKRMVDFCAGLAYALDGEMHLIVDRLFLLAPSEVYSTGRGARRRKRAACTRT
jgi:cell division inhibitor SepF